jgi:hypothetical protein
VIELNHGRSDGERMVQRQRLDAGAEADARGALGGGGDEHLGRADHLVAAGVMLADPRLVEPKPVEMGHQLEIALEEQRRRRVHRMEWREEDAESKGLVHRSCSPLPAQVMTSIR